MKHLPHENPERLWMTVEALEEKMFEECQGNLHEYVRKIAKRMVNFANRVKQIGVRTSGPSALTPHVRQQ
jgi:hypothetical protein